MLVLAVLGRRGLLGRCGSGCARWSAWAQTAGAIAAGDLSRRVEDTDTEHRGGPPRRGAQRHAGPDRDGLRRAGRVRGAAAPVPGRRLPRAAHAADLDPGLRRAVPPGRRPPARRPGQGHAPHRGRGRAHGRAGRGPAAAGPPRRGPAAGARAGRHHRVAADAVDDARARDPEREIRLDAWPAIVVSGDGARLHQVVANLLANALEHTPAGVAGRGAGVHGRRPRPCSRWPTTAPGSTPTRRPRSSTASTGPTRRGPGPAAAPASAWPSSPPSSTPTAARWRCGPAPGQGATFRVMLPGWPASPRPLGTGPPRPARAGDEQPTTDAPPYVELTACVT